MTEVSAPRARAAPAADGWHRLSPWSMVHFTARTIVQNIRAAVFAGGPATYGVARSGLSEYAWVIPIGIVAFVVVRAVLNYLFCSYRLHGDERELDEIRRALEEYERILAVLLEVVAEGLPNESLADRPGISDQTMKFHLASISGKLGHRTGLMPCGAPSAGV